MIYKKDFPIFTNNPGLVFLDSTSTTQKSSYVIDWVKDFYENSYANIHRGSYDIALQTEKLYKQSKQKFAQFVNAHSWREIIYTLNSTYAANLLASSIARTGMLQKWDVVLLSPVEHHANIVPWLILKEDIWIEIKYANLTEDYQLDLVDLEQKLANTKLKVVSLTHVSNVTWVIFPLEKVWAMIGEISSRHSVLDTESIKDISFPLFIIDASQSVPHFQVDVQKLHCDAMFCTAHKFWAESGIGVLYGKQTFLESLKPAFSWGWAISHVHEQSFTSAPLPEKFEPGTPNVSWAVSVLKALEYIENIGGYTTIEAVEQELVEYFLQRVYEFNSWDSMKLIGSLSAENKVWVFSFTINWIHALDIADALAEQNICVRGWQHCAEPLMNYAWVSASVRVSFWIYTTKQDIDIFFETLEEVVGILS